MTNQRIVLDEKMQARLGNANSTFEEIVGIIGLAICFTLLTVLWGIVALISWGINANRRQKREILGIKEQTRAS